MAERAEAGLNVKAGTLQALTLRAKPLRRFQIAQTVTQLLVGFEQGPRDDDAEAVKTRQRRELKPPARLRDEVLHSGQDTVAGRPRADGMSGPDVDAAVIVEALVAGPQTAALNGLPVLLR